LWAFFSIGDKRVCLSDWKKRSQRPGEKGGGDWNWDAAHPWPKKEKGGKRITPSSQKKKKGAQKRNTSFPEKRKGPGGFAGGGVKAQP